MIEQILVTHLERRPKRRYMALGTLAALDYPLDKIKFFKARDSSEYPDDGDEYAVIEAMRADGFYVDDSLAHVKTVLPNKQSACVWQWTWCSLLRHIAVSGTMSIHLCDDMLPLIPWERMNLLAIEANEGSEDFNGIQLSTDILSKTNYRHDEIEYYNSMLGRGLLVTNDFGEILSPRGAEALLRRSLGQPYLQPHDVVGEFAIRKIDRGNWFHVLQRTIAHNYNWHRDWVGHPDNPETPGAKPRDLYPAQWLD